MTRLAFVGVDEDDRIGVRLRPCGDGGGGARSAARESSSFGM